MSKNPVEEGASEQEASEQEASEQEASEQEASEQEASEQVASEQVASEQVASEQVASEQVASEQVAANIPDGGGEILTAAQSAARLGISRARVLTLIKTGQLPAVKRSSPIGDYWEVRNDDLDLVRDLKNGRPPGRKPPAA